uniref:F-Box protein n=1 Tax=Solanum tuberosum TaxID=4113 RepID=M0ZR11_SOLTU
MKSEASHRRPKGWELRKGTEIPSKDSMGSLPEELIIAILVRVPVKYLLQFKCVSKYWFNLISSPEFVKTHLSFSAKDYTRHISLLQLDTQYTNIKYCSVSSLFHNSVNEALDLDCPMNNPPQCLYILGSVNGLVCLSDGFDGLVIWNPSIRKFNKVFDYVPTQIHECWSIYGFGYDEVHHDYKHRHCWGITSIDLVDEKWGKVELPSDNKEGGLKLGLLGSDLSVLCNNDERTHSDVWVMKEYGVKASWTKLYTITYPENYNLSPPLFMYNKGEILLAFKSTFAIYNPKNDSITYPEVPNVEVTSIYEYMDVELCIERLVCPDLPNED